MEIAVTSERCSQNPEYPARTQKEIEDLFWIDSNGHAGWEDNEEVGPQMARPLV